MVMTIEETMATCVMLGRSIHDRVLMELMMQSNGHFTAKASLRGADMKAHGSMNPQIAMRSAAEELAAHVETRIGQARQARACIGRAAFLEAKLAPVRPAECPEKFIENDDLTKSIRLVGRLVAPIFQNWNVTLHASVDSNIFRGEFDARGRTVAFSAKLVTDGIDPIDVWGFREDDGFHRCAMEALDQLELVVERNVAGRIAWLHGSESSADALLARLQAG